jgi:hypothetical protein
VKGKEFKVVVKTMKRAGAEHAAETWLELTTVLFLADKLSLYGLKYRLA